MFKYIETIVECQPNIFRVESIQVSIRTKEYGCIPW